QSFKGMEESDPRSYKLLERAISDSVVVTKRPDTPEIVANSSAAAQLAGFRVRTLKDLSGPQRVQVNGEVAFHMTVDRDRLVSVLDEIGRPEIQIPEAVDGATLSVHIPKTVFSMYGDCKSRSRGRARSGKDEVNEVPSDPSRSNCTLLVQAPSPSVTVPPDLNMSDVAIGWRALRKVFGDKIAVRSLSLEVPRGEVFGFLGPNGAGKSTSVKMLLGLVKATAGQASILGRPAGHVATRRRVGFLPEH